MQSVSKTVTFPQLPAPIEGAMQEFEESYLRTLESSTPSVATALAHLRKGKGKQIRPLIVFLVASAFGSGRGSERWADVLNGAISIELLHLASLIHDDVIDESAMRRGQASFYALFGSHKAVLFGDYILSHAFTRALLAGSRTMALTLAELGLKLSEGELLQEDVSELSVTTEEQYFEVISRKTASLINAAFKVGADTAGVTDTDRLGLIGRASEKIGLAFQIKDDIFDYLPTPGLGKPAGNDLREHKVTLPLIFALGTDTSDARKAAKLLKKKELDHAEIEYLLAFARRSGGIEYAQGRMARLIDEAKRDLESAMPAGDELQALLSLADYIVFREK